MVAVSHLDVAWEHPWRKSSSRLNVHKARRCEHCMNSKLVSSFARFDLTMKNVSSLTANASQIPVCVVHTYQHRFGAPVFLCGRDSRKVCLADGRLNQHVALSCADCGFLSMVGIFFGRQKQTNIFR